MASSLRIGVFVGVKTGTGPEVPMWLLYALIAAAWSVEMHTGSMLGLLALRYRRIGSFCACGTCFVVYEPLLIME